MIEPLNVGDLSLRRVAIVDDDAAEAEGTFLNLEDAQLQPIILSEGFETIDELVLAVRDVADCVICDHHLSRKGYARFHGAEAVATLNRAGIPSVLLTIWDKVDAGGSIRRWRDSIPVVINREGEDPGTLRRGLQTTAMELTGTILDSRRAWNAMIEVLRITSDAEKLVVDVLVPGWRPLEAVRIPGALLPNELQDTVGEGDLLVGRVNIGAETSEELFFKDIRRASDPLPDQVIWPT